MHVKGLCLPKTNLDRLIGVETKLGCIDVRARRRVRGGHGVYAFDWRVYLGGTHPADPPQHMTIVVSLDTGLLRHEAGQDERLSETPAALMADLGKLADATKAVGGFVTSSFFVEDAAAGSFDLFSGGCDTMTNANYLQRTRFEALGEERADRALSLHWANLLTWPMLEKLGGADVFAGEFNERVEDRMHVPWYLHRCSRGLIARVGSKPANLMLMCPFVVSSTAEWLDLRLRAADLYV